MPARLIPIAALATALLRAAPASAAERIESGDATATVTADPWTVEFEQAGGPPLVSERGLEVLAGGGRSSAVRATSLAREGDAIAAEVELDGGGSATVRIAPAGEGSSPDEIDAPGSAQRDG